MWSEAAHFSVADLERHLKAHKMFYQRSISCFDILSFLSKNFQELRKYFYITNNPPTKQIVDVCKCSDIFNLSFIFFFSIFFPPGYYVVLTLCIG